MTQDRPDPLHLARTAGRWSLLAFAFLGAQLRRLPGYGLVDRFSLPIAALMLFAALGSVGLWGVQRSPQRISMAELGAGTLSPMQTWIIVSGDLQAVQSAASGYRYVLTDPATPRARLYISSRVELAVGKATVSGTLLGSIGSAYAGIGWVGQLRADPVLAPEQDPPWIAIALATGAVLIVLLARTSYPVFFGDQPRPMAQSPRRLRVAVRQEWSATAVSTPGTLEIDPGEPVRLRSASGDARPLRLYSARSSLEVGRFRRLSGSEPVLLARASGDDLALSFESAEDRDCAYAALAASAALPRRTEHSA